MLKRSSDEALEILTVQTYIDGGVDSCLLGVSERVRAWNTEPDDQDVRPFKLDLLQQPVTLTNSQVKQENGWIVLLQNGMKPFGVFNNSDFNETSEERPNSPNEIE